MNPGNYYSPEADDCTIGGASNSIYSVYLEFGPHSGFIGFLPRVGRVCVYAQERGISPCV
jgi:hypothetical protein